MVLRLSCIVQVSSFNSVGGLRLAAACIGLFRRLPLEAMQRRAEIVEHGREVTRECGTTAD
jgi:hypothetical protein